MSKLILLLTLLFLIFGFDLKSQVVISDNGSGTPEESAVLKLESTTKGFQLPTMTLAQMYAIQDPVNGLMVFVTDDNSLYYYIELQSDWVKLGLSDEGVLTDPRDDQTYRTIQVGNFWIMAENLNYGTRIDSDQAPPSDGEVQKYCYKNDEAECDEWGAFYRYSELTEGEGICPPGWTVPVKADYEELVNFFGGSQTAGASLKARGDFYWQTASGSDLSGFSAIGAGSFSNSNHQQLKEVSRLLTSDNNIFQVDNSNNIQIQGGQQAESYSVRCYK